MTCQINPNYKAITPFIENIEVYFKRSNHVLYDQRNIIRVVTYNNKEYVVKAFKQPNVVNRIVYRFFRPSKAKRSYLYSLRLGKNITPDPVAYIENFKNLVLTSSYYISDFFDYDFTIHEALTNKSITQRDALLREFADFTFNLHEQKILHHDYSHGNILIKRNKKESKNQFTFKIIDINRMAFKPLNLKSRLNNFARIKADDDDMKIIITRYAKRMNLVASSLLKDAIFYRNDFYKKREIKHKLRGKNLN